jgi:D-alanyl-D-alanine carboxypeptidase
MPPETHVRRRKRRRRTTLAAAALLVGMTVAAACGGGGDRGAPATADPPEAVPETPPQRGDADLERQMTAIVETHRANREFVGATLAIRKADGTTVTVTSGTKEPNGDGGEVDPDIAWGIGSATKTFVAVVVLQLAEEGRIDLDAGIDRYLPDLAAADRITPRQLLQHTSGLGDYLERPEVLGDAQRPWTVPELIAAAEAGGRTAEPGGPYDYSNTNYLVLGEIIERVTGNPWVHEVQTRILEPLDMHDTQVADLDDAAPGFGVEDGVFVDYTDRWHPSIGGAAGGLRSTAADLLVFTEALASGQLLSERSPAERTTFIPGEDLSSYGVVHEYGLGLERYATEQLTVDGHLGSGNAYSAFIGYDVANGTAVVVMMNTVTPGPQVVMGLEALAAVSG